MSIIFLFYGGVVISAILCASVFEWTLHRFVMHRPVGRFRYPFEKHTMVHHRIFKADRSYHCVKEVDQRTIRMAWWNGPVLIGVLILPWAVLSIPLSLWAVLAIFSIVSVIYFCGYEYLHWCMHLPKPQRLVGRWMVFRFLNGHHLLHHRYMSKNFNVICPFADLMFGTLLLRAPKPFPQPWGSSVPNVQPPAR